jgi:hypothetical protein
MRAVACGCGTEDGLDGGLPNALLAGLIALPKAVAGLIHKDIDAVLDGEGVGHGLGWRYGHHGLPEFEVAQEFLTQGFRAVAGEVVLQSVEGAPGTVTCGVVAIMDAAANGLKSGLEDIPRGADGICQEALPKGGLWPACQREEAADSSAENE